MGFNRGKYYEMKEKEYFGESLVMCWINSRHLLCCHLDLPRPFVIFGF